MAARRCSPPDSVASSRCANGSRPTSRERLRDALRHRRRRPRPSRPRCANRPSSTVSRSDALRRRVRILRQEPEARGDLAARERARCRGRRAAPRRAAGARKPGECAQQQRLAGAIATEQRDEFAGARSCSRDASTSTRPRHRDAQLRGFEQRRVHWLRSSGSRAPSPRRRDIVERLRHLEGAARRPRDGRP